MALWLPILILLIVGLLTLGMNVGMKRKGYSIPGKTIVRCSKGHYFTTLWIEGGSLKAVRLGPTKRAQRCPVCKSMRVIVPIKDVDVTDEIRAQAALNDAP
jgi:hypothetical protein